MIKFLFSLLSCIAKSFGEKSGEANRTEYYMTTKNLLIAGGDAVEKLMTSYKEVAELAGYASRVEKVLSVFDEVSQGNYSWESLVTDNLIYGGYTFTYKRRL